MLLAFCPESAPDAGRMRALYQRSYRDALECFLPLLRELEETVLVRDLEREADALYRQAQARGERCLLLCFAPPSYVPRGLSCPALCVFDWVVDALPELWSGADGARFREVLAAQGCALALSRYAAEVLHQVMGDAFAVAQLPVPVFDRFDTGAPGRSEAPLATRCLSVTGRIFDSWDYEISEEDFRCRLPLEGYCTRAWSGAREELHFDFESEATSHLGGFFEPEGWGIWSRTADPWIALPFPLSGNVKLTLLAAGYGWNVDRTIAVEIGASRHELTLHDRFDHHSWEIDLAQPAHRLQLRGLDAREVPGAADHRSMGIGIRWLAVEGSGPIAPTALVPEIQRRLVEGVVYTTLDADVDDLLHNCWRDVIKAFCYAFRDNADAVLVVHVTRPLPAFFARFRALWHRIGPVRCRILLLHGELDGTQYRELIAASTYYVHALRSERLCLPLLEFMSAGTPVLVATHLAPSCGASAESGYLLRAFAEAPAWPNEKRSTFFRGYHGLDWQSLVDAFAASYRAARRNGAEYRRMSRGARDAQARASSDCAVRPALESALGLAEGRP